MIEHPDDDEFNTSSDSSIAKSDVDSNELEFFKNGKEDQVKTEKESSKLFNNLNAFSFKNLFKIDASKLPNKPEKV